MQHFSGKCNTMYRLLLMLQIGILQKTWSISGQSFILLLLCDEKFFFQVKIRTLP